MDQAPFKCPVEVPPGSRQQQTVSVARDMGMATETFKISNDDIGIAISYIIGYDQVLPTPGPLPVPPGGFTLSRQRPARHPFFKWLRATKIVNIVGRGGPDQDGAGLVRNPQGDIVGGKWNEYFVTVQFEQPTYQMLSDSAIFNSPSSGNSEYMRWCTISFKPSLETLARKGIIWTFVNYPGYPNSPTPAVSPTTFPLAYPGDVYLRQPKGILEIKWFDVPQEWCYLGVSSGMPTIGGLIPSNILQCIGTLNSRAFPQQGIPINQIQGGTGHGTFPVQYPPGTLLMLEPDVTIRTRFDPSLILLGDSSGTVFPRSCDWTLRWLYFNPVFDLANCVKLFPTLDLSQNIVVQGHNLLPIPPNVKQNTGAVTGFQWYPAVNNTAAVASVGAGGTIANLVVGANTFGGDIYTQYRYANHELVFSYAR